MHLLACVSGDSISNHKNISHLLSLLQNEVSDRCQTALLEVKKQN
jgi:hypothetical protein